MTHKKLRCIIYHAAAYIDLQKPYLDISFKNKYQIY